MRSGKAKLVLMVSLLLNISFLASAGYQYYKQSAYWISPFGMKIKKGRFLFEELSLKPGQIKTLRNKAIPFRKEIDGKMNEIAGKREELIDIMRADRPDVKAINSVISEISRMQEEVQKMIVIHMLDMKAGLDKDQQQKFLDLIEDAVAEGRQMGCPPAAN